MRVVVIGGTGNVGSAVVRALSGDDEVDEIVAVARRVPALGLAKVRWRAADVFTSDLRPIFDAADSVIHLAWAIQPAHDEPALEAVNVDGSKRVFEGAAEAEVPSLIYASSVGAYSQGPKHRAVDESWPTEGISSLFYSRHKAAVERHLDAFEARTPEIRVVRLRPGLIFSREAAVGIRRLFLGPLFPGWLAGRDRIPVVPDLEELRFQAVHTADVAEAYRLAVHAELSGAFNIAADPVLDPEELARVLRARRVRLPAQALRAAADLSWRLHLQPSPPGWLDLGLSVPIMSTARARELLAWKPSRTSTEALLDLLAGLRSHEGFPTPPLHPRTSGRARWREFATGIGSRL
jgi:nucleoside-diphosphate-sugar epimerase